jgi:hypothetical protein
LDKEILAVGDSAALEIILSTRRYKSRVVKKPRIQTNEGPPDKHVQISANVVVRPDSTYPIVINPYKIDLSQFTEKVIKKAKFMITNVSDQELDVSLKSLPRDIFEVKLPKRIKPGSTESGEIKLMDGALGQSFQKSITIELTDADSSRFTIPVKRTVRDMTKRLGAKGNSGK